MLNMDVLGLQERHIDHIVEEPCEKCCEMCCEMLRKVEEG